MAQREELIAGAASNASAELTPSTYQFDAFISYSHDPRQAAITAALQRAVHGFAKPFWKRRSVHLFRDQTNLSVNPDLWGEIVDALRASKFLILIASPEAAKSQWVAKEIDWWLSHRESDSIIIVLVTGALLWNETRFSDSGTTALPKLVQTAFRAQPLWLDLTSIPTDIATKRWRSDGRFVDAVASIASRIRRIPKEDLFGEDRRRHRQTIAAISMLMAAAIGAAGFAEWQRRLAVQRADETTAALIWSRLDFEGTDRPKSEDTVRALWYLATAQPAIRAAFLRHLKDDDYQVLTLAAGTRSIVRALGLDLSDTILKQLRLPIYYVFDQDRTTLLRLNQLAEALVFLDPVDQEAERALNLIIRRAAGNIDHLSALKLLASGARLAKTPEQAAKVLQLVGDHLHNNCCHTNLDLVCEIVASLAPNFGTEETKAALQGLLYMILNNEEEMTDLQIDRMQSALKAVASMIDPSQTVVELEPFLDALDGNSNSRQIRALATVVQELGAQLPDEARQVVVSSILDAFMRPISPSAHLTLAKSLHDLRPTNDQTARAIERIFETLGASSREDLPNLVDVIRTLDPTTSRAPVILSIIDGRQRMHPNKLNHDDWHFAVNISNVIADLNPSSEQSVELLKMILRPHIFDAYTLDEMSDVAQALRALSSNLDAKGYERALGRAIGETRLAEYLRTANSTLFLAAAGDAVAVLDPTQAQAVEALGHVAKRLPVAENEAQVVALVRAVGELGKHWASDDAAALADALLPLLALTNSPLNAEALAGMLSALWMSGPRDQYIEHIVELLKYPTSAGPATQTLLVASGSQCAHAYALDPRVSHLADCARQLTNGPNSLKEAPIFPDELTVDRPPGLMTSTARKEESEM